ncbi:MAG: WecB/TagA/CpsF family glycosyltransferase [Lachnospiraceae bacterium]|nr:WecB/TagA/CpsF family glycosyltransferase [Lachnospiraceae bacterium]
MSRIKFLNTEIDNLTMDEALERIDGYIKEDKSKFVVTANVDHIVQLEKGGELTKAYKHADMILTDGQPLIWISRLYKIPIREKISGSDLFPRLCDMAARKGYRMYFLGAEEGVAAKAAGNLKKRFYGLQVVGTYSPPKGFENDEAEKEKINRQIKEAAPHILIIGLGTPKQELFMFHNKDELGVPVSLGLGASLDFEAGTLKRAPRWMSSSGLEWFYRLLQDPGRLAKRYLVDDMKIWRLIYKYRPAARKKA